MSAVTCAPRSTAATRSAPPTARPTPTPTPTPAATPTAQPTPEPTDTVALSYEATAPPRLEDNVSYLPDLWSGGNNAVLERQRQVPGAISVQDVHDVNDIYNAVDRNEAITLSYRNEGLAMDAYLGEGAGNNWAIFASWASARAGETIRGEDSLGPFSTPTGSQAAISYGNREVHADVAPVYASFLENPPQTQREFDTWAAGQTLDPLVRAAFQHYFNAHNAADPNTKAQETGAANLLIGAHEQWMLQPQIEGAIPGLAAEWLTQNAMDLTLPGENLKLGQDIPGGFAFEPEGDLAKLVSQFDRPGSGAHNWASYDDRMNFITQLFLTYQFDDSLKTEVAGP